MGMGFLEAGHPEAIPGSMLEPALELMMSDPSQLVERCELGSAKESGLMYHHASLYASISS